MKTWIISFVFLGILTAAASAGWFGESGSEGRLFTKHFDKTLFEVTGQAAYSVEVLLDDSEYDIGRGVIGIVVHNTSDKDVEGAVLTMIHRNLATGETAPDRVVIKERGDGLYIISGIDLERDGRWELDITVKKDDVADRVVFLLPDALKNRVGKGRYSP